MNSLFISFEGIDGCGKSTQAELLKQHLESKGHTVVMVREPGGTPICEQIRTILLSPENRGMDSSTETILLAASRAQLTRQVILPALREGKTVICDRYADSTLAYQGYGRGIALEWLKTINDFATNGQLPDATILVDVPANVALKRLSGKSFDRMEREGSGFLDRVRKGYLSLAQEHGERYIVVDGRKSIDILHQQILRKLEAL